MTPAPRILCLAGPTGSGKTAAALHIAAMLERCGLPSAVINADSRQVYRDFPIITAQPSEEEKQVCPHKLYGWLETTKKISADSGPISPTPPSAKPSPKDASPSLWRHGLLPARPARRHSRHSRRRPGSDETPHPGMRNPGRPGPPRAPRVHRSRLRRKNPPQRQPAQRPRPRSLGKHRKNLFLVARPNPSPRQMADPSPGHRPPPARTYPLPRKTHQNHDP